MIVWLLPTVEVFTDDGVHSTVMAEPAGVSPEPEATPPATVAALEVTWTEG